MEVFSIYFVRTLNMNNKIKNSGKMKKKIVKKSSGSLPKMDAIYVVLGVPFHAYSIQITQKKLKWLTLKMDAIYGVWGVPFHVYSIQ